MVRARARAPPDGGAGVGSLTGEWRKASGMRADRRNPRAEEAPAGYRRRWRLPPPPPGGAELLEGGGILEEVEGPLGLLLWQCMRDVALWASTPSERREGLFSPEAEPRRLADVLAVGPPAQPLDEALRALAGMLAHPSDVAPEAVMLASQRISVWAEGRGAVATALAFAQAAAGATPASARSALRVGRLARRRGEYSRAEGWLQRAVLLARQESDPTTHAFGYSALGNLYYTRGNMPLAERHHLRALRISERHCIRRRSAAALHDLFVVCAETSRVTEALGYARRALAAYGPKQAATVTLAHDVALLWLERGEFAHALPVLEAVWPHMEPPLRVLGLANTARAAGALGQRSKFEECHRRLAEAFRSSRTREHQSPALLNLARGAASLGEWDLAASLARQTLELAERLGESKIRFSAENLLQSVEAGRRAAEPALPTRTNPPDDPVSGALADELVACFSTR